MIKSDFSNKNIQKDNFSFKYTQTKEGKYTKYFTWYRSGSLYWGLSLIHYPLYDEPLYIKSKNNLNEKI